MGQRDPEGAVAVLEALREGRRRRRELEAEELRHAATFADLNGWVDSSGRALPGVEQLVAVGGDGVPEVAEFCTLELAAALGMRDLEARWLLADALDLRHRLPRLWQLVAALELPAWQARKIAQATRELDRHAAGLVDAQLSRQVTGMSWRRVEQLVEGLVLEHLPDQVAEAKRRDAMDARGVWIRQAPSGVADVSAVVDAPDGVRLDDTVGRIASILTAGGAVDGPDGRRAQALGILASPARALQLLQASLLDELPVDVAAPNEGACPMAGEPGHTCGQVSVDPEQLLPRAQLVLHLTDTTLVDGTGAVRAPGLRPLLAQWLHELLGSTRVTVRPVIDANHQAASDAYEAPPTMREAVEIRNSYEVFPWSSRRSRRLDMDHTIAFVADGPADDAVHRSTTTVVGGDPMTGVPPLGHPGEHRPPGQTRPDNLTPLTRKVHRAKTHGGWRLRQPWPGVALWESPLGFRYLVTPSRTIELGRPDTPRRPDSPRRPDAPEHSPAGPAAA